jgi:hypothetical protein
LGLERRKGDLFVKDIGDENEIIRVFRVEYMGAWTVEIKEREALIFD